MSLRVRVLVLALPLLLVPRPAPAAWPHDPAVNLPVTGDPSSQYTFGRTEAVPDGAGGIICFWDDYAGVDNLRAQRIAARGDRVWGVNGVLVQAGTNVQQIAMCAIPDGAGGAILAWQDMRNGNADVYAQRLDAGGNLLWPAGSVAVCTEAGNQFDLSLSSDGSGGAWIVWTDARGGAATDIYARRVNGAGVAQGAAAGIAVCVAAGIQSGARTAAMTSFPGCTIVWRDQRTDGGDIYGQRLDFAGVPAWAVNGAAICNAAGAQQNPAIVGDGGYGSIAAWSDSRSGVDIYAQRTNSGAGAQWAINGVVVCAAPNAQLNPMLVRDGAGGVVVAFTDYRNFSYDIYAQRLSVESGNPAWASDGLPVCTELGEQHDSQIVADGAGGTYVSWNDRRLNELGDVYVQRLSGSGYPQWTAAGVAVAVSPGWEYGHTLVPAGPEGCLLQMVHENVGAPSRLAAQKVDRWGYLGGEPTIVSATDVPNDQGGWVKVSWYASPLDVDPLFGVVSDYLVFRSAPESAVRAALARGLVIDAGSAAPDDATHPGRLLRTVDPAGVASFWEAVGQQAAQHLDSYSAVVATTGDSVAGSNPPTSFMVQARNWSGAWWNSEERTGYSVDDLAPPTPQPFDGVYSGGTALLTWGAVTVSDLAHYRLYRGPIGFVPSPASLVAEPVTTTFADAAGAPYQYQLTAVDVHGNESAPAVLLPQGATAVDGRGARVDFLAPLSPQPLRANAEARVRFGLARDGHARLTVHDVQGRRLLALVDSDLGAGEHSVAVPSAALSPGMYIVRLVTPWFAGSRRLIVVR